MEVKRWYLSTSPFLLATGELQFLIRYCCMG